MKKILNRIIILSLGAMLVLANASLAVNVFADEDSVDIESYINISCSETNGGECVDSLYGMSNIAFSLNGNGPVPYETDAGDIEYHYEDSADAETVTLGVETLWHMKPTYLSVNGEEITIPDYIDYDDQASYLEHYNGQIVSFKVEIPKDDNNRYEIFVTLSANENKHIGNFLWTADPAQKDRENYIGHSSLALIAVSYTLNGITYSCNIDDDACLEVETETGEEMLGCKISEDEECGIPHVEFDAREDTDYDDGSLVIPAGARVTMRVIPDYGYQVLNVNMSELETSDDGIGEFTFTVPAGAAYFTADVVKLDDEVEISSEKVTSGIIDLGEAQTTLNHGTARLNVSDVELTDENKEKFAEIAETDGYEVKNYLDISLYNITYKGTEDEAWSEQVKDLNEPATITLKLEDDIDGNEIVIVHEKHDGTYEVIETTYDPETNTITFATTSFSNYAIASRTVTTPNTGMVKRELSGVSENILTVVVLISLASIVVLPLYWKSSR